MVTYNSTAWNAAKRFVLEQEHGASVVCIQEHHLVKQATISAQQQIMAAAGWRAFFSPALQRPEAMHESHSTGGVAILVREELAASDPVEIIPGRALAVSVAADTLAKAPVRVVSAYLVTGHSVGDANNELASDLGCEVAKHSGPWVIGADWQASPQQLLATGLATRSGGRFLATPDSQGTCRSSKGDFAHIDYFLVSAGLAETIKRCPALVAARANPHLPVALDCEGSVDQRFGQVFRGPPPLPTTRVYGPIFQRAPPQALAVAIAAVQAAVSLKSPAALAASADRLYNEFLPAARADVAFSTDTDPGCPNKIGQFVRMPATVIDRKATFRRGDPHAAEAWALDRFICLHSAWKELGEGDAAPAPVTCPTGHHTPEWKKFVSIASTILTNPPRLVTEGGAEARSILQKAKWWATRLLSSPNLPAEDRPTINKEAAVARGQRKAISNKAQAETRAGWTAWAKQALTTQGAAAAHSFIKKADKEPTFQSRPSVLEQIDNLRVGWADHWRDLTPALSVNQESPALPATEWALTNIGWGGSAVTTTLR